MKKYLLLALCLMSFSIVRAQSVYGTFSSSRIHVTVIDSMYHDSTVCTSFSAVHYNITVDTSFAGDSLRVVDTFFSGSLTSAMAVNYAGSSPWTFTLSAGNTNVSDVSVPVGGGYAHLGMTTRKITTVLDTLRYITYSDSIYVNPCLYSGASGIAYIDNNYNCIYDAGDVPLNFFLPDFVEYFSSPGMSSTTYPAYSTYSYGSYTEMVQQSWMTSYTISLPPAYAFIFPMSPCFSATYTFTTLPQTGIDFPMLCTSNVDVQCYALSEGHVRLHTPFLLHPYVSNTGCDSMSGTMTLVKDSRVIYNAALSTNPADTVRGDTLIWNYTNLTNLSSGAYWNSFMSDVYLTPDTTLAAGDTVCFRVYTNIPPTDVNPLNNDYTICLPVVYSYDPNSKTASPGTGPLGILPAGTDSLVYTINFQNTGSDYAYDVKIIDTLDSHLNPHSLKILGTSHTMTPYWLAPNVVEFDYAGIMLPDSSTNEPASHGQVRFSVALAAGVPPGTQIKNMGYIYFDSNPPVVTNTTTSTTSTSTAGTQVITSSGITVYPNPAADQLTVDGPATGDITVLSMSGSVLMTQHITNAHTTLDISRLPAGVYMLKTVNEAVVTTTKFSKY